MGQTPRQLRSSVHIRGQTPPHGVSSLALYLQADPSSTRDNGFARLPTGRVGTQPVGGFAGRALIFGLHIHAPGEDAAVRTVDCPLARGYARRSTEARFEVPGRPVEDVDEAHVFFFAELARLRQADLEQPQLFSLSVSLGEVPEQFALVVSNEAALYSAFRVDLAYCVPGPRIVAPLREIRGTGTLGQEEDAGQARLIPAVESIDEGDHEPGHLPWMASVRERGVVTGDDYPCRVLVNYRLTLYIPALRVRLSSILIYLASNKEEEEYHYR